MAERAIPEASRGPAPDADLVSDAGAVAPARPAPLPVTLAPPPDEALRRAGLVRMKRVATGLLVVAALVFVVARLLEPRYPWLGYVRATAEAAMVGGLADWFAVTALFRRPLGLPIPHTAIIPTRKDRVGRSLGGFVQRHFLAREVIAARLGSLRMAERLATWLAQPENARLIARQVTMGLAGGARLLRDEDVQLWIDQSLGARVRSIQIAPLLGRILALVTEGDRHQELLNAAIRLLARAITDNRDFIRHRIEEESPWWVPGAVDDRIHEKVVGAMERTIAEVRDDPVHPLRLRFDTALHDFIDKLQTSPEVQARAEALKLEMLDAEAVRHFSGSLWGDVKDRLQRYAEAPDTYPPGAVERGLTAFGEAVLADPALLARCDQWLTDVVTQLVERYQHEVGALIETTVASWDPEATSQRIELAIGRDLQYIRVNGTLVGGLAGLLIYILAKWF